MRSEGNATVSPSAIYGASMQTNTAYGEQGTGADVTSTLAFEPPTLVRWSRFDASGSTRFITAFYCCPAGANAFNSLLFCYLLRAYPSHSRLIYRLLIYSLITELA